MNLSKFLLALVFVIGVSAQAFADSVTLFLNEETNLLDCGGWVRITKSSQGSGEQVNLIFSKVTNCSNFDIVSNGVGQRITYDSKKLEQRGNVRGGSFTIPKSVLARGWNEVGIELRSNSGKTSDFIRVQVRVVEKPRQQPRYGNLTLTIGEEAYLPECGGRVAITKSPQGNRGEQVNLVFTNVERCTLFDIVSNDGLKSFYEAKEFPAQNRSSFTLPKSLLDYGWNNVKIVVKSPSGYFQDTIKVQFLDFNRREPSRSPGSSTPVVIPVPSQPSPGTENYTN